MQVNVNTWWFIGGGVGQFYLVACITGTLTSGTISGASENFGDFKLERLFRRRSRSSEGLFLEICRFFGFRTRGFVFGLWASRLISGNFGFFKFRLQGLFERRIEVLARLRFFWNNPSTRGFVWQMRDSGFRSPESKNGRKPESRSRSMKFT